MDGGAAMTRTTIADTERDLVKRLQAIDKTYADGLRKSLQGVPLGYQRPDEFATENPNWLAALPFVDGAADDVRRYMRLLGLTGDGLDWRAFCGAYALRISRAKQVMVQMAAMMAGPQEPQMPGRMMAQRQGVA